MMYAARRFSCPSFFHPSTNRRMYKLLSNGLIGAPCGVPRPSSRLRVLRCLFPFSSVSSTGASSHILIRCSIAPSTIRRATDFRRSECGIEWSVLLDVLERLAVHACCSAIRFATFIGECQHILSVHLVVQSVEAKIGRSLRFVVQRRLQLLNTKWSC